MKAPSPFTVGDWSRDAARRLTAFVAQVARALNSGLTFEDNVRAEWREITWIAGQSSDVQINTTITQPRAVLVAGVTAEQDVGFIVDAWGIISTDGAGAASIADAGTGGWTVALNSNVVEVTLDPPMASTTYVPSGAVLSTTHRFVVPEVSDESTFLLHVWNASSVEINASSTALTLRFDLRGQRLGRPVGAVTAEWDRSQGGVILRSIDGLVYGQRYQVRLLVVER